MEKEGREMCERRNEASKMTSDIQHVVVVSQFVIQTEVTRERDRRHDLTGAEGRLE